MSIRRQRFVRFGAWANTISVVVFSLAMALSDRYWFEWSGKNYRREFFSSRGVVFIRAELERLPPGVMVIRSHGLPVGWHSGSFGQAIPGQAHWRPPWQWRPRANLWSSHLSIELPLWIPILAASLASTFLWWSAFVPRRRARAGLCPNCAYTMVGLTTPICPECGSTVPTPSDARPR